MIAGSGCLHRIGGLREDLPRGFHDAVRAFLDDFRQARRLRRSADPQRICERTRGGGKISEDCLACGLIGPIARAAGVVTTCGRRFRTRLREPGFRGPTRTEGTYARGIWCASRKCGEHEDLPSAPGYLADRTYAIDDPRITPPPKDRVYTEMEALIQHFLVYSQGFTVPAGEAYVPIEGPRGEHGFTVVSDGTNRPWRIKARPPSLLACQALERMIVGGLIADVIAVIGSIDVVMGDVDR